MDYKKIDEFIDGHLQQSIEELTQLCKFPSVSAKNQQLPETALFVGDLLKKRGFEVKLPSRNL